LRKDINIYLILVLILPLIVEAQEGSHQKKNKNYVRVEKLEDNILDTILKIPKVVKRAKYVEDVSKGRRHLADVIYARPTTSRKYYWIKVRGGQWNVICYSFQFFCLPEGYVNQIF